ncbi:atrial natriuretic peptide receptor 1-like [Mya arenaria]|uniref:atrial natriuretic peptide receptor 1-like n=1 Tax=Mya arenaria TaxID=6604 RepID=UPI0022E3535A|nr:atrial natriuretic peptide receptor 1-like [Mya arenaria]
MFRFNPTVPTLTWLPLAEKTSYPQNNSTAISTYMSLDRITAALVATFRHFKWHKLAVISAAKEPCSELVDMVNSVFPNMDLLTTRVKLLQALVHKHLTDALTEIRDHARVVLVCLPPTALWQLLVVADELGMSAKEYVFLYIRWGASPATGLLEHTTALDAVEVSRVLSPLLQVSVFAVDNDRLKNFTAALAAASLPELPGTPSNQTDEFSVSLYETVLLAADMLHTANITSSSPLATPSHAFNFTLLKRNYTTMFGEKIVSTSGKISRSIVIKHYQDGDFFTVGHVAGNYHPAAQIRWPGGNVPPDSPQCGWQGELCDREVNTSSTSPVIIGTCVAVVILGVVGVVVFIVYRKSRLEKDLLSTGWKVNAADIRVRRTRHAAHNPLLDRDTNANPRAKLVRMETRGTLGLGSTSSIDKTLLFAPVGSYKGSIVALKTLRRRSIQLTRETLRDFNALRELTHDNLNPFIGASMEPGQSYVLMKYCSKGSLQDVLENDDIKLDSMFKMSFLMDLIRGMDFLHKSVVRSHGNLKSSNCVIDSRWVLKLTDYGALCCSQEDEVCTSGSDVDQDIDVYARLLWTAPELLRMCRRPPKGSQRGDVYSVAIIMQEVIFRCPPFFFNGAVSNKEIISKVQADENPPYRPRLAGDVDVAERLITLMCACWNENPDTRPDVHTVLKTLMEINGKGKRTMLDNMLAMLETYSNNLEALVVDRTEELALEKHKTDTLLCQMLPPLVAEQLKRGEHVVPETFSEASVFFSDIVGFTSLSGASTPLQVIDLLNGLYTTFDEIIEMHDVYKVETIGDAYMVASGVPRRCPQHAAEIANMALDLLSAITSIRVRHLPEARLQLRIGLHMGPCAAGVVGQTMPRYCLFGDTINMASRMESTGKALHIHVSSDFAAALRELNQGFLLMERGVIEVKGKGQQKTYWLIGKEGYTQTLPEETQRLREKFNESVERGRPPSPTDTCISSGSQFESTSMYGNAFRRASNAILFIRQLSNQSNYSGHSKSRLVINNCDEEKDPGDMLTLPVTDGKNSSMILPRSESGRLSADGHKHTHGSSGHRKRKKAKTRHKSPDVTSTDHKFLIPKIEVTNQSV